MSFHHSGLFPLSGGSPLNESHSPHVLLSHLTPLVQTAAISDSNGHVQRPKSHKKKKGPPSQSPMAFAPPPIDMDTLAVTDQCGFCDYFSDKKDRMRRHIRTVHLREKPFRCDLCPLAFGRKDKLKRHVDTVHTVDKPYKCDFCGHASGRKDKLKYHVETTHLRVRPGATAADKRLQEGPPKMYDAEGVQ